jgi:hypothetical protein
MSASTLYQWVGSSLSGRKTLVCMEGSSGDAGRNRKLANLGALHKMGQRPPERFP